MSLVPAFELGLWNAWIFILPIIIIFVFGSKILGRRESEEGSSLTKKVKKRMKDQQPIKLLTLNKSGYDQHASLLEKPAYQFSLSENLQTYPSGH